MKKLLLGLGTLSLAILPVAAMVSCSSAGETLNEQQFDVKVSTTKGSRAIEQNVIDPAFNTNAQEILNNKINSLTVAMLQADFDMILTDFYDIYEFESGDTEIELSDKGIKVLSIGDMDEATGFRTAKLVVSYEIETEAKDGTSEIKTKEIDWIIRPTISSQAQIDEITKTIKDASTNTAGVDISDLKEYFLGENDNDDDFDDLGVFDRINALNNNKKLNNIGGLIGYELKLSDIYTALLPEKPKVAIDMDTVFFAPSASLENTFVYPSSTGKFKYEFDISFLKTQDKATVLAMTTAADLASILVKDSTQNTSAEMAKVKDIQIIEMGSLLKLTVNFKDAATLSEVISINPALLKPTVNPPVEPTK